MNTLDPLPYEGFNSKLVRLKDTAIITYILQVPEFQFQTGSIKRPHVYLLVGVVQFQFQTGSIKRCLQAI